MSTTEQKAADLILESLEQIPETNTRGDKRRREALRLAAELVRRGESIEPALQLLDSSWSMPAKTRT